MTGPLAILRALLLAFLVLLQCRPGLQRGKSSYCGAYASGSSTLCMPKDPSHPNCVHISRCCCEDDFVGQDTKDYCDFLARDTTNTYDGWQYPHRGRHPNPPSTWSKAKRLTFRCYFNTYCLNLGEYFRVGPNYWEEGLGPERNAAKTNKLRFTDSSIAQEGISFCIVGRHYRRSAMSLWAPLHGFLPIAEKNFDIGNHIDPDDSTRMNAFRLPDARTHFLKTKVRSSNDRFYWNTDAKVPSHEYEAVFLAQYDERSNVIFEEMGYKKRPAHPDHQPDLDCPNPYHVYVTEIEADGKRLHNYLHIKVYAEPVSQSSARSRCPTGKMKFLMLEVRDRNGYPVGQFTDDIPCDQDEVTLGQKLTCPSGECRRWTGTKKNVMPCMYSHPKSTVHPTIFMMSAPDIYSPETGKGSAKAQPQSPQGAGGTGPGQGQSPPLGSGAPSPTADDPCRFSWLSKNARKPSIVKTKPNDQYFTEVHATWRYAQMNNGWIDELHFATMIIEDETPIQYYTSRSTQWVGAETDLSGGSDCSGWTTRSPPTGSVVLGTYSQGSCPSTHDSCCRYWNGITGSQAWYKSVFQLALINRCVHPNETTNRPYGYSAKYTALKPTFKTMGGWEYFQKQYVPGEDVNCHVDITYGPEYHYELKSEPRSTGGFSRVPVRSSLVDFLKETFKMEETVRYGTKFEPPRHDSAHRLKISRKWSGGTYWHRYFLCHASYPETDIEVEKLNLWELPDWHTVGVSRSTSKDLDFQMLQFFYLGLTPESAALKMFRSAHQDPVVLRSEFDEKPYPATDHFGSRHLLSPKVPEPPTDVGLRDAHGLEQRQSMKEMAQDLKVRCPCPFFVTTPPPELQTKSSKEIDGRQIHVINMTIAWMFMVPLALFVARFFKETYSKVFFLQEFWWFTIHVLCLLTTMLFTVGGIYGLKIRRDPGYQPVWTTATHLHIYGGYTLVAVFTIHLALGMFRFYDIQLRMIIIALHWGFGWLEYCLAVAVSMASIAIPSGMMNCVSMGIYIGFVGFQLLMTAIMEYHIRYVTDVKLKLIPPRSYMPSPMMRVFHRDAPYSDFRIAMLVVFVIFSLGFYTALHVTMRLPRGEEGCFQPSGGGP